MALRLIHHLEHIHLQVHPTPFKINQYFVMTVNIWVHQLLLALLELLVLLM